MLFCTCCSHVFSHWCFGFVSSELELKLLATASGLLHALGGWQAVLHSGPRAARAADPLLNSGTSNFFNFFFLIAASIFRNHMYLIVLCQLDTS